MKMRGVIIVASAALLSSCNSEVDKSAESVRTSQETTSQLNIQPEPAAAADKTDNIQVETKRSTLTPTQMNAVRSAEQYLSMSGFSKKGLIQQLSSDAGEGYDISDATAAVNSLSVDWNENAAKSATQYLGMSGFSCKGLIQQLSSSAGDKYTVDEATYGARQAGAC